MPRRNLRPENTPLAVEQALVRLGANLAAARRRRRIPQRALARSAGVALATLGKVESGHAGTSIGVYFMVVWALGLERELFDLVAPERDEVGKALELGRLPKRARARTALDDDF